MADPVQQALIDPMTAINIAGAKEVKEMITPPDLPEQKVAPVPDDEARKRAAQRAVMRKYEGAGRAGTMLTGDDSKLG